MRNIPRWQYQYLGIEAVPRNVGDLEFAAFFTFSPAELAKIKQLYKPQLRLGAALQLGFVRMTGRILDAVKVVPSVLLKHIGQQLEVPAPNIASLRAMYSKRTRALWEHQAWALDVAHFKRPTDRQFKRLLPHLREQAKYTSSVDQLMLLGRVWLYQNQFIVSSDRRIRDFAREALADTDSGLLALIQGSVNFDQRAKWEKAILATRAETGRTQLEWLQQPPRRKSVPSLRELIERRDFLLGLGVDKVDFGNIAKEKLDSFGGALFNIRPSKYKELKEPTRTLRLGCFLKMMLLQVTDTAINMGGRMVTTLMAKAHEKAKQLEVEAAISARSLLDEILETHADPKVTDKEFRTQVGEILAKMKPAEFPSRAAAARWQLSEPNPQVRSLLNAFNALDLHADGEQVAHQSLEYLRTLYKQRRSDLPADPATPIPHPRPWSDIVEGPDRQRAMRALEAATLIGLRRGLRSGGVWTEQSENYRSKDELLISKETWEKEKRRHYRQLGLPLSADDFIKTLTNTLEKKLENVAAAMESGDISFDEGKFHFPKVKALAPKAEVGKNQDAMFDKIDDVQLPDLILEMDAYTGFSRMLLGRPARNETELLQVYGGMLAHGTSLNATGVALMIDKLTPAQILIGMQLFENKANIRAANDAVASYIRTLPISSIWGDGSWLSSDMMSMDVSRQVWAARSDYRRRTASIGTYATLADFRGVVHDMPVILNERQVGPAIDGVLHQTEFDVENLAVDTHGYTAFGMAVAKCLGFALCPRLAAADERHLFVPRSCKVPPTLRDIVDHNLSLKLVRSQWDEFVRVVASIGSGQVSATVALARYGSSAIDNPVYRAGVYLGRLVRTIYLCDYFTIEELRRTINRMLVLGESVHFLRRAIYQGDFSKPRGRREVEQIAMSGSLNLMTNLCIAWTARQMQLQMTSELRAGAKSQDFAWLAETSPARFQKINFRGTFRFPVDQYVDLLIGDVRKAANG